MARRKQTDNRCKNSYIKLVPNCTSPLFQNRLEELDALRGVGVVLMLLFHFAYDLKTFLPKNSVDLSWIPYQFWTYTPTAIGMIFFFVLGISCWTKRYRHRSGMLQPPSTFFRSGLTLLGVAFAITFLTAMLTPKLTIFFGAIHCIAVNRLIIFPFLTFRILNLVFGILIICIGIVISHIQLDTWWFLWLGLPSSEGAGGDWYPLAPWFGVSLIGVYFAPFLLRHRAYSLAKFKGSHFVQLVYVLACWLGRHSLAVYLIHQPVLIGALYLVRFYGF